MKCGVYCLNEKCPFQITCHKFFLSDLLCPSDWKLHYLSISTREIRYSGSGNADLLKRVLLPPLSNLDPEMGELPARLAVVRICTREPPAGFWGTDV